MERFAGSLVAAGLLVLLAGTATALADARVLESNVAEFPVGARISNPDGVRLPAGGRLRVLISPANETRVLQGPESRELPLGATRDVTMGGGNRKVPPAQ